MRVLYTKLAESHVFKQILPVLAFLPRQGTLKEPAQLDSNRDGYTGPA